MERSDELYAPPFTHANRRSRAQAPRVTARRQSRAIAQSTQEQDDLAFIESIADWTTT